MANDLHPTASPDHFWMPFTANRQFKAGPRLLESAEGLYYTASDGRQILDGTAGLWCCNAGHGRREISEAVSRQIAKMDFAPTFQMGHPLPFELAEQLSRITPPGLNRVFFTNSGSESVDTALKVALAYQRAIGQGTRTRLIGRELAYHGVGFGGISVGGMPNNRRAFGALLPGVDHLPHTLDLQRNAFSRGLPQYGVERADELERLVTLHGAENIAAVIVEPMSGSAGVILPPLGYLQRLREITARHGILLIFDEVITGFGRVGKAFARRAQERDHLFAALAAKYGDGWPAMHASLLSSFAEFEQHGFCLSLGDWDRNVMAAGVPLRLADGSIMALTCGAPSFQLTEDTLRTSLARQLEMLARDIESLGV
ncbi:Adenosylmethionine-8-amino-7-oxononanoate aminotransferase [Stutzerimonas stutzeri]